MRAVDGWPGGRAGTSYLHAEEVGDDHQPAASRLGHTTPHRGGFRLVLAAERVEQAGWWVGVCRRTWFPLKFSLVSAACMDSTTSGCLR